MVRNQTKIEINKTLDEHPYFTATDFNLVVKGKTISIQYEFEDKFYFRITLPIQTTTKTIKKTKPPGILGNRSYNEEEDIEVYKITGKVCPGEMVMEEPLNFEGKNQITSHLWKWLNCIWEELSAGPIKKMIDEQNEEIEKIKSQVNEISDDYFTQEEANELKRKLDTFEEKFKEHIQKSSKKNGDGEKKLRKLEKEIGALKETIGVLNKRTWYKSSISKMYKWIASEGNRNLIKNGTKLLKPLLPDSVKDIW
jgi:DNA repair exonuclease SbcCD ATPase subunit